MTSRVSLAELAAANIRLRPAEAVAVVAEICRRSSDGRIRGIPSPGIIRLTRDGAVAAEGPITTGGESVVRRAAHLLNELLPESGAPAGYRASGGLRLAIARALGTVDLPPYATLDAFSDAIARFSAADLGSMVRNLFHAWDEAMAAPQPVDAVPELTISDIRRARRATGLSLDALSEVAEVPAARLRELEWGYLRNWRADDEGRRQLVRYAQAAGLDETVVVSIAWPMIEDAASIADEPRDPVVALVPSGPQALVAAQPIPRRAARTTSVSWAVVAVAAALLALATYGVVTRAADVDKPAPVVASVTDPVVTREVPPEETSMASPPPLAPKLAPKLAPQTRRAASARPPARPPRGHSRRATPRGRSLLDKELFRIVIR